MADLFDTIVPGHAKAMYTPEGIYNTSDQNQQLKDTRTADQSSLNQNNIVTSNIISSSNQNNIIKPQIRDESLHWSMANNLVQTI